MGERNLLKTEVQKTHSNVPNRERRIDLERWCPASTILSHRRGVLIVAHQDGDVQPTCHLKT
jgi:hypothetical protein